MVFEKAIAAHCHEHNLPGTCAAVSAIVGLHIDQFRRFRYDEMQSFAQKLISGDKHIKLSDQKMRLLDAVQSLSLWFDKVQNDYNCELTSIIDCYYAVLMVLEWSSRVRFRGWNRAGTRSHGLVATAPLISWIDPSNVPSLPRNTLFPQTWGLKILTSLATVLTLKV